MGVPETMEVIMATTLATTASSAISFDATDRPAAGLVSSIGAYWQRLSRGRRNNRRRPLDKPPVQTEIAERETLPVILMSPFGGYYFGRR